MKTCLVRMMKALVPILILFTGLIYWFLFDGRLTDTSDYSSDMVQIRQLADSMEGDKPTEIQVEKVAQFYFFQTLSRAGSGFDVVPMGVYSFKAVTSSGHVLIDVGYDEEMALSARADFYPEPYQRMQTALNTADLIVVTHEHYDHIGGIVQHPNPADILPNVILTTEQVAAPANIRPRFPQGLPEDFEPFELDRYAAIAPGIVLIKANGHTPGSLMVFVQLENGREYLFVGDIAWHEASIDTPILRPRVITQIFLPEENRDILSAQLRFLNQLSEEEEKLIQVAGHDNEQIEAFFEQGLMSNQFRQEK